jgi:hypothetical protein
MLAWRKVVWIMAQTVFLKWRDANAGDGSGWNQCRCLYAYRAGNGELLYVGKAWGKTVRERWRFEAKAHFWTDLNQRQVLEHSVTVGTVSLLPGERLTSELLSDAESLLIHRLRPWGNIQSVASRIERPGLQVHCSGDWVETRRRFRDAA